MRYTTRYLMTVNIYRHTHILSGWYILSSCLKQVHDGALSKRPWARSQFLSCPNFSYSSFPRHFYDSFFPFHSFFLTFPSFLFLSRESLSVANLLGEENSLGPFAVIGLERTLRVPNRIWRLARCLFPAPPPHPPSPLDPPAPSFVECLGRRDRVQSVSHLHERRGVATSASSYCTHSLPVTTSGYYGLRAKSFVFKGWQN